MTIRSFRFRSVVALVAAATLSLVACGGDEGATPSTSSPATDRAEVVARLVDDVVVPANAAAADTAAALLTEVESLCAAPTDATLASARDALSVAWAAWEYTDTFDLGPAMDRRSISVVSYEPDPAKIDAALAASPPADAETVRNRTSSSLRGFGAAAHLLFGSPAAPVDLGAFTTPGRCDYLEAVAAVIAEETSIVDAAWTEGVDGAAPFRDTATGEGPEALSTTDVVDDLVNMQVSRLESSAKALIAASEVATGESPDLSPAFSFRLAAYLDGVTAVYEAIEPLLDDELAGRVADGLAAVRLVLDGGSVTPSEPVPDSAMIADLAAAVTDLRSTIATEVVSALDVTITFSDNDGDS